MLPKCKKGPANLLHASVEFSEYINYESEHFKFYMALPLPTFISHAVVLFFYSSYVRTKCNPEEALKILQHREIQLSYIFLKKQQ